MRQGRSQAPTKIHRRGEEMEISVLQTNLSKALSLAKPLAPSNGSLPATHLFRVSSTQGSGFMKVEATNLEQRLEIYVPAMTTIEGGVCVEAARFKDFISTLGQDRVDLVTSEDPYGQPTLKITCGTGEATILGQREDDFPPSPDLGEVRQASIDPDVLVEAIKRVNIAVTTEQSRPSLTGAQMVCGPDGFELAGADGFRLALQVGKLVEPPVEDFDTIIPKKGLETLARLAVGSGSPVGIELSENGRMVRFQGLTKDNFTFDLSITTINGTFPNFKQLIPTTSNWNFRSTRDSLLSAVNSAAVYAHDSSDIIRFWTEQEEGSEGELVAGQLPVKIWVSAKAQDVGDAKREADCLEVGGLDAKDSGRIAFNTRYMTEFLKTVGGEIEGSFTTPASPGVFRLQGDDSYVQVVMPMFVQW